MTLIFPFIVNTLLLKTRILQLSWLELIIVYHLQSVAIDSCRTCTTNFTCLYFTSSSSFAISIVILPRNLSLLLLRWWYVIISAIKYIIEIAWACFCFFFSFCWPHWYNVNRQWNRSHIFMGSTIITNDCSICLDIFFKLS